MGRYTYKSLFSRNARLFNSLLLVDKDRNDGNSKQDAKIKLSHQSVRIYQVMKTIILN